MNHVFQFGTISQLRKIYETHTREAQNIGERAHQQLATAAAHAALAHDAALLLNETDPEWVAECEAPIVTRTLRLRAWREMLDFLEAHPEIGIGDYESVSIEQPDGERATPEYLATLEHLGIKVERGEKYATAELWFGSNHDVKLTALAKLPQPPEIEPVTDPAAIEEHQALVAASDADEMAGRAIDTAVEATGQLPGGELLIVDPAHALTLDEAIVPPELLPEALSTPRGQQPIQINDRVRVRAADVDGSRTDFPERFEGREGIVTEVRADAFTTDPAASGDAEDLPIDVMLDGESEVHCFAVAEVEVLVTVEQRIETMDRLLGQPA